MTSSTLPTRFSCAIAALLFIVACRPEHSTNPEMGCLDPTAVDPEEATELYLAAWGEEDPVERVCLLQRSLASDAIVLGSTGVIEGRTAVVENLDNHAAILLADPTSRGAVRPIQRRDEALLAWVTTDESGGVVHGEDWLEFDEDGLLSRVNVFAGTGADAALGDPFVAWQEAWNTRSEGPRADALSKATTEDIRFTDVVSDVRGREALGAEIGRQQDGINAELRLADHIQVFSSARDEAVLVRLPVQVVVPQGGTLHFVDYVRLKDGRIERLSGFASSPR